MSWNHNHSHSDSHSEHTEGLEKIEDAKIRQKLVKVLYITAIFMIIEFISGVLSNSLALISDAVHMLTDAASILLALVVFWVARRPRTAAMSYGYYRAEILGSLASGLGLWFLSGLLIFEAVVRLRNPPIVNGSVVFVVGMIGLFVNWIFMRTLHGYRDNNLNLRAAYLHIFSDFLGSLGAIIAGLIIWTTGWYPADAILTILFTMLILYSSWKMIREAVDILMERFPKHINPQTMTNELKNIAGVIDLHDLHVWSLSSGRIALSVHLIARDAEKTVLDANELLKEKYAITHTTIQIEHPEKFQSDSCITNW